MLAILSIEVILVIIATYFIRIYFRLEQEPLNLSKTKAFKGEIIRNKKRLFIVCIAGLIITVWLFLQFISLMKHFSLESKLVYILAAMTFFYYYVISLLYIPFVSKEKEQEHVCVIIPVYNENPITLMACLNSIFNQSRLPDEIHVVNDGSSENYIDVEIQFIKECALKGIYGTWQKQKNAGKRHAQIKGMKQSSHDDQMIVITIDSDSMIDQDAIKEGLIPFQNENVQSVAGLIVCNNYLDNWLVKIAELVFISQQLTERTFSSLFGSVPVNSGALSFYRKSVINRALEYGYLNETFNHQSVIISDDSFLTLIAMSMGRTVFQSTAIVYSDMPIKLKDHFKQQIRWSKGSFIRSFWRLKYSNIFSVVFIKQFLSWLFFPILFTLILYILFFTKETMMSIIILFIIPLIFGYFGFARYLGIKRKDMTTKDQLKLIIFYTPIAVLWSFLVLRLIKIYSMLTVNKQSWGTRIKKSS